MSVFKIKNSNTPGHRWVAQLWKNGKCYRVYSDPKTGKAIANKARAKEIEHQLLQDKGRISEPELNKHPVSESREAFQSYLQKKLKPTSLYQRIEYFDREILPFFRKKNIEDLTNDDLELFNDKANAKMSPGRLANTVDTMRAYIRFCRKWNQTLLPENIFKFKTAIPHIHTYHFYTLEEEKKFLSVIKDPRDKLMFTLFCFYGFRLTECLALQRSDIDLRNQTISIRKIVQTKTLHRGQVFLTPKTKRSIRTLALIPAVADLIPGNLKQDDYLFPARLEGRGKVEGEISVRRKAKKYAMMAGLEPLKVHEFRHSCASNLLRENVPLRVVANWLGDTEATILNFYSHMFTDEAKIVPQIMMDKFSDE